MNFKNKNTRDLFVCIEQFFCFVFLTKLEQKWSVNIVKSKYSNKIEIPQSFLDVKC